MRVLVVGGGGREHALVHSFVQSSLATQVFCAPGNAGIAAEADCVPIGAEDVLALLEFALKERPDLTVIGPEAPLVAGVTDLFRERGLLVFGPDARAAAHGGQQGLRQGGHGRGRRADRRLQQAHHRRVGARRARPPGPSYPVVVKADGLAAGKGVIIAKTSDEARAAVEDMLVAKSFGGAGEVVVVEEHLVGSEVSLLVLCDGETAVPLAPAQDYKRIFAGDQGPNTGGMGSYCPVPGFEQRAIDAAMDQVVEPVLATLKKRGITYRGVLYAGLIVTADGTKVLEFNCRFGDPETQAVLPRLNSDLLELCLAAAKGELAGARPVWTPQDCVTVVLASAGYPASSHKGDVIEGPRRRGGDGRRDRVPRRDGVRRRRGRRLRRRRPRRRHRRRPRPGRERARRRLRQGARARLPGRRPDPLRRHAVAPRHRRARRPRRGRRDQPVPRLVDRHATVPDTAHARGAPGGKDQHRGRGPAAEHRHDARRSSAS